MLDPIKVRQRRLEIGMSQQALADAADLHLFQISHFETPAKAVNPLLTTLEALARALGCEVWQLLSRGSPEDRAKLVQDPKRRARIHGARRSRRLPSEPPPDNPADGVVIGDGDGTTRIAPEPSESIGWDPAEVKQPEEASA